MAGAPCVVGSLWKVNDAATQALMAEFYRNLWEENLGTLEALRQAQLAMLRGDLATDIKSAKQVRKSFVTERI